MTMESFQTEGPHKVAVSFHKLEGGLVRTIISGSGLEGDPKSRGTTSFVLDTQEFKSLLKAGLRFDERISP